MSGIAGILEYETDVADQEVPLAWMRRPKQGFLLPFEGWLAAEWKPYFENVGSGSGMRVQTWYQKWSLFVLTRWCEALRIKLPGIAK